MSSSVNGRKAITELQVGETAYTVPWALVKDVRGQYWLRSRIFTFPEPRGVAAMHIERQPGGFVVWPRTWQCKLDRNPSGPLEAVIERRQS